MQTERWRRIQDVFHRAVDLDADARRVLLNVECGTDHALRAEVEALLKSDDADGDVFSRIDTHARPAIVDPLVGRTLGAYRVTERLGAGGMGVVYRAERADGLFRQEVAIKLIRSERATEWMLRRFEFERRTLAALQHPCIARLFDGGTTEDGSPYFVMEFVRGEAIDRYCERERATVDSRLRLFVQVCRAVHFAHQSLVVHCDLKPANILIDERGQPRLLDFGIARLLKEDPANVPASPTEAPATPRTLASVLTPEYASPEQLAGGAVTTSIDVYSLGVVLYELLTGRRPFESESRSPADWERIVREQAPERPSTRVQRTALDVRHESQPRSVADAFRSTPASLRRTLRGDLDRIVLMALRKEPERRYASVQEFADDVDRYLNGLPVHARPDSVGYRTWKFVRRNRVAVAGAGAVLGALTFGLVSSQRAEHVAAIEARNARHSESVAAAEALKARASERLAAEEAIHARMETESFQSIASFLMDAFLPTQPAQDAAWQAHARERILAHAERVHRQYADQDHVRANMLDALGHVCMRLELVDDARKLLEEAAAIRAGDFGVSSLEYALSLRSLGQLAYQTGDYARAAETLSEALAIHRSAGGETHANVGALANDLAACYRNLGRADEAEALHREALALRRGVRNDTLPVAESLNNLAGVHQDRGEFDAAVAELREALDIRSSILGEGHLLTLQSYSNLASVLWRHGDRDEALRTMHRAEVGYRALGSDGDEGLGLALSNLAEMQTALRDLDAAASILEEARALQTRRLGPDHPVVALTLAKLANVNHLRKRDGEARALWRDVLRIRRAAPAQPRELADALYGNGVFLHDVGEFSSAIPLLEEAIRTHREQSPGDPAAWARCEYVLGMCLERTGQRDTARGHYVEALRLLDGAPNAVAGERERVQKMLERLDRTAPR